MPITLTMRLIASFRSDPIYGIGTPRHYTIDGLPPKEQGWILKFSDHWRLRRAVNGSLEDWNGHYETAEEALAFLQHEFDAKDSQ